jgi:hypothetical protein
VFIGKQGSDPVIPLEKKKKKKIVRNYFYPKYIPYVDKHILIKIPVNIYYSQG